MPLSLYFSPSFKRSLKKLGSEQVKIIALVLESLGVYYSSNCNLDEARKLAPRFFCKQLRRPYWEAGVETGLRVIIKREDDHCVAVLAGNHNQIRQFLLEL